MNGTALQARTNLESNCPPVTGDDDDRPIAGLWVSQRHVAAAPGLRIELSAGVVHVNPTRLDKLRGMGNCPNRRPDRVVPAPRGVSLHHTGVAIDDLVINRINRAPNLECRDPVANIELVYDAGQVKRAFVTPLATGLAPFLAGPKRLSRSPGLFGGVAALVLLINLPRFA